MHDRFHQCLGMRLPDRLDHIGVARSERDPGSGSREIHNRQSNEECRGCDDLEVNERFDSHAPDLF